MTIHLFPRKLREWFLFGSERKDSSHDMKKTVSTIPSMIFIALILAFTIGFIQVSSVFAEDSALEGDIVKAGEDFSFNKTKCAAENGYSFPSWIRRQKPGTL